MFTVAIWKKVMLKRLVLIASLSVAALVIRDLVFLSRSSELYPKMPSEQSTGTKVTSRIIIHDSTTQSQEETYENLSIHLNDMYYSHTQDFVRPPDPAEDFVLGSKPPFIPHIIHQTWDSDDIPKDFVHWMQSWARLHPTWQYWLWTPKEVRLMLAKDYPEYLNQYNSLDKKLYQANAMRYFIMHKYGGVYADLDLEAIKPLDPWTYRVHCLLPEETLAHPYLLHNSNRPNLMITLLACRPGHPFFKLAIDRLPIYPNLTDREKVLFVDSTYKAYNATEMAHSGLKNFIVLGHPDYFLPTYDRGWKGKFQAMCNKRRLRDRSARQLYVCDKFLKTRFDNKPLACSYTDHHWFHVVLRSEQWKERHTMNIRQIIPHHTNITQILLEH